MKSAARDTFPLFPVLVNQTAPVGLARMAAEGLHAEDGHDVDFRTLNVRSILNRSVSRRQYNLDLSINPYRGCEFACRYCYARYTHAFLAPAAAPKGESAPSASAANAEVESGLSCGLGSDPQAMHGAAGEATRAWPPDFHDPATFERVIFIKQNAAWLLEQELKRADPQLEIALGTATDPYQPIERRALVTRSILEVFARHHGRRIGIVTKSCLIVRDLDLLRAIAQQNRLVAHITITTLDSELARKLEPRAPRPDLRLATVRCLREAGIETGVLCSPLLPGITDSDEAIDAMARHAAAAGACFFSAQPLFLKPCSRGTYLAFVQEHFPTLREEYERRFGAAEFAAPPYRRQLALAVARACRRYRLRQRSRDGLLTRPAPVPDGRTRPPGSSARPKGPHGVGVEQSQQRLFG